MEPFTSEEDVRARFDWTDVARVSSALIERAITDAHTVVMQLLDSNTPLEPVPEGLKLGETMLAGACVLGALAARDAVEQRQAAIGGQRIEEGNRFEHLRKAAIDAEASAWECVAPYLRAPIGRAIIETTTSMHTWA